MSRQMTTATTTYNNIVSGTGQRGKITLTSSHFSFTFVEEGAEAKNVEHNFNSASSTTKTIKVPWSKVVNHQITPSSEPAQKLKLVTKLVPAAGSNSQSQAKQTTKTFVFPDRQSLVVIRDDIQRRISENHDGTRPTSITNSVNPSRVGVKSRRQRAGNTSAAASTGPNSSPMDNVGSESNNDFVSHSENRATFQGNQDTNEPDAADFARQQAVAMVLGDGDDLFKRRAVVHHHHYDREATTPSVASRRWPRKGKGQKVKQTSANSKGKSSSSTLSPHLSKVKNKIIPTRTPVGIEDVDSDVLAMLLEKRVVEYAITDRDTSMSVNPQQHRPKMEGQVSSITSATLVASFMHSMQETVTGNREEQDLVPISQAAQMAPPAPVLRRCQNVRAPTQVGAVSAPPSRRDNSEGEASQASSNLTEDIDLSGVLVQAMLVEDDDLITSSQRIRFEEEARIRILDELVVDAGPAVMVDPAAQKRQTRRRMCALVVGALSLMAVILGSVLGTASTRDATERFVVATLAPTTSSIPSLRPSTAPSLSHSPSKAPSIGPTVTPDNRYCNGAKELFIGNATQEENFGGVLLLGAPSIFPSTASSTAQTGVSTSSIVPTGVSTFSSTGGFRRASPVESKQFPIDGFGTVYSTVVSCGIGNAYRARSRWYRMTGVGPVTASTCNPLTTFQAQIQIYTDVDKCQQGSEPFVCAEYSGGDSCAVSWVSLIGEEYLIHVFEPDQESSLGMGMVTGGSLYLELLDNDLCENAFPTSSANGTAQTYLGSLDNATPDTAPSCGGASAASQPGTWYKVSGTGGLVQADTCEGTNVDTQISVYQGSCDSLECVDGDDNICGYQSAVSWNSELGITYYILVHAGNGTSSGPFSLTIHGGLVRNEICANAEPLSVVPGGEIQKTVPLASAQADSEAADAFCLANVLELFGHPQRGVWYSVNSTGATYTVSIQDGFASVSVLGGSCEDPWCIVTGYQGSSANWTSKPGEKSLIYVHYTRNDESGDVQMTLSSN